MSVAVPDNHAALMDGVYRHQRHIYDLTRKYYLLGRDRMVARLDVPDGGTVLELGCGTGRNIIMASSRYPHARFLGLDISASMLDTARRAMAARLIDDQVTLAQGDATAFDAHALFGTATVDRVFFSYALSMIPGWERALARGADALSRGGSLHVVDFGQQEGLPGWFSTALRAWLRRFHVEPRADLVAEMQRQAQRIGGRVTFEPLFRGYAWHIVLRR